MRLLAGTNADLTAVARAFEHVWDEGNAPDDGPGVDALAAALGADPALAAAEASKAALRAATDGAIARGVFGVPTFAVPREGADGSASDGDSAFDLFWGVDAMPMLLDHLADPALFDGMADLATVEYAVRRR